ncbi:MAG: hypothetical protein R3E89_10150 [Thiolinea sp.]
MSAQTGPQMLVVHATLGCLANSLFGRFNVGQGYSPQKPFQNKARIMQINQRAFNRSQRPDQKIPGVK